MSAEFEENVGRKDLANEPRVENRELQDNLVQQVLIARMAEVKNLRANVIENPVPAQAKPDAELFVNGQKADSFELATGHKIVGSNGRYRISDTDGNSVNIFPNGLEAFGKVLTNTKDNQGNSSVKFTNGSTIVYNENGRLNITGANGKSSTITLDRLHQAPLDPQIPRLMRRW